MPPKMKMTTIKLLDDRMKQLKLVEIMWPPADGVPEVLFIASYTFVIVPDRDTPTYRKAKGTMGITNVDF